MSSYRYVAVAAVLAILLGLGKGAVVGLTLRNDLRLRDEGVIVQGTVVSKRRVDYGRQAATYVTLRYTDRNGTTRSNETHVATTAGLEEGASVRVRYDPDKPDVVLPVDEQIRVQRPIIQLVIDGMLLVGGLIAFVVSSTLRRREERRSTLSP